ncbi:MMPL family transporter [Falsarthrobacter nasiphocae]|uniref:RND superfamily putative drug exporter n=1 Tax=Falsarthrobacter nasiphocae TaxID=189863 RepID=A0AAE3YI45_9MICC|nr:MMPL family transporter [Falsarthrobacter nasiphocae]MDR6892625.1 RND superfamily putative drug exporter [Falsarthrobacter nasiphocae]
MPSSRAADPSGAPGRVKLIAVLALVLWVCLAGIGGPLVGKLGSVQNNDTQSFLPDGAQSTQVARSLEDFKTEESLPLFITVEKDSRMGREDFAQAQGYAKGLIGLSIPGLSGTLGDYLVTKDAPPLIPSEDGSAFLIPVNLAADKVDGNITPDGASKEKQISNVIVDELRENRPEIQGATVLVTGPAAFAADLLTAFGGIDGVLLLVTLAVVLVILVVVYRSPILPIAVLFTAVSALALAALVIFPLARSGALQLSGQSQGILFILVVGAATDYCLLFVARYREEFTQGTRLQAVVTAWKRSAESIIASGVTVIAGLLCLLLADLGNISSLGPIGALGVAAAVVASLTLLPALLLLLGKAAFWPAIPKAGREMQHRGWTKHAQRVTRRPRLTWAVTGLALVALSLFAPTFKADGISQADFFTTPVESVEGNAVLERHFPSGEPSAVQVTAAKNEADAAKSVLERTEGVNPKEITTTPSRDGDRVLLTATLTHGSETPEAEASITALRGALADTAPNANVGGPAAVSLDTLEAAKHDERTVMPAILAVVFVLLIGLLRSLTAPLMIVLVNVLSFAASIGVSALVFNHVFHFKGADASTPLLAFVFLVALAVDYSIFLMVRAREESLSEGTERGIITATAVTGGVITSAGLVLAATFAALSILPIIFMAQIAFIVGFGVLLDTFVTRSILVPALTRDLGDRVWWPWFRQASRGANSEAP